MSNFQNLDQEEIEQDQLKSKLDLITITTSKNLEDIKTAVDVNTIVNTTQVAFFDMQAGATNPFRTYAETTRSSLNTLTSTVNTHETEINALQSASGLFSDCIKFAINGSYAYTSGVNTGSAQSITDPLSATPRRYILVSTDTYSSNIILSDNNTTFRPNESGEYLSIISAEFYDNSADTKLVQLELIEKMGSSESSKQIIRNNFTGSSTVFEYGRLNSTAVVTLNSSKDYWYKATGSANGGYIRSFSPSTAFTLIKISKSF